MSRTALSAGALACVVMAAYSCRSRVYNKPKEDSRPRQTEVKPAVDPKLDNRSPLGGLRGSSDYEPVLELIPTAKPGEPRTGPVRFQVNGDYPEKPDAFAAGEPPTPDIDKMSKWKSGNDAEKAEAKAQAQKWLVAMQAHIYAGMNEQNNADSNDNFRLDPERFITGTKVPVTKRWFHMPWLHTPNPTADRPGRGRDGQWGLTRELDLGQTSDVDWPLVRGGGCIGTDWGIGFFNEPGGYAIGKVFPKGDEVKPEFAIFPEKTVSFKILFTSAKPSDSFTAIKDAWTINALVNGGGACGSAANGPRSPTDLRHVQMDVMMKVKKIRGGQPVDRVGQPLKEGDEPAYEWIFGNYVHNKAKLGEYWKGMEPLGVQWGPYDGETIVTSEKFKPNGYQGRMNGPADNPNGSCLSCHARAQWPEVRTNRLAFAPKDDTDKENICLIHEWGGEGDGKCRECGEGGCLPSGSEPLLPGAQSLDYAMQFGLALRNRQAAASRR